MHYAIAIGRWTKNMGVAYLLVDAVNNTAVTKIAERDENCDL
jgi:hypothetical protein